MKKLTALIVLFAALTLGQNPIIPSFPGTTANDAKLGVWSYLAQTNLSGTINSSVTSFNVSSGSVFRVYTIVTIDSEKMMITGISGNTLTVTRGFNSTTQASHSSGTLVRALVEDYNVNALAAEVIAIEGALGANLANVNPTTTAGDFLSRGPFGMIRTAKPSSDGTYCFSWVGSSWSWASGCGSGGGGSFTLNGLTGTSQNFSLGTGGTDINISSIGTTHTFNFPSASSSNRGPLTSTDWTTFNGKENALTFSSPFNRATNTISLNMWGSGTRPVAASSLGSSGNCAQWTAAGLGDTGSPCGSGGGGANASGFYFVSTATNIPANGINLGLLTTGLAKITQSAGVASISTIPLGGTGNCAQWTSTGLGDAGAPCGSGSGGTASYSIDAATGNGSTSAFTLTATPLANSLHVYVNGQLMEMGSSLDYTLSTATVNFASGSIPASGARVSFHYTSSGGIGGGGSGIATINGLGNTAQLLSVGTAGTDFTINSTGSTHTFNIPNASSSNRGLIIPADYATLMAKESALTFTSPLSRSTNTISVLMWGAGTRPVAASALGTSGNCAQWTAAGLGDTGSPCGSGSGSSAFNAITSGTNSSAAMICSTGCSLSPSGTGSINANQLNGQSLASLATGPLKNTTSSGVPSIASAADIDGVRRCVPSSASGSSYACNTSPSFTLSSGTSFLFRPDVNGTGGIFTSLTVNATTALIKTRPGGNPSSTDLVAGQWYELVWDGTNFQMQSKYPIILTSAADVVGILPVANGGTGTNTPTLIGAGTVSISGSWPNQTVTGTGGSGGISYASSLVTVSGNTVTIPTTVWAKTGPDSARVYASASTTFTRSSGDGRINFGYDGGYWYFWHSLTGSCGAGAVCVGSTATFPANVYAIGHVDVSGGVLGAVQGDDGPTQGKISFNGFTSTTVAGEQQVTWDTHIKQVRVVSGTSDSVASTDTSGLVRYTSGSSVAVTVPSPGTSGMANGLWFGVVAAGAGTVTLTGGTYSPSGKNIIPSGGACRFTSDGSSTYTAECSGGGPSSGGITTYVFSTPGSHPFTCGPNGYVEAEGWGGASSGGAGYYTGGHGGTGGGHGKRLDVCTPGASVPATVGAGGATATTLQGNDGADTTVGSSGSILKVTGGKWLSDSSQSPGYDATFSTDVSAYFYVVRHVDDNSTFQRSYTFLTNALTSSADVVSPLDPDLGSFGTNSVGSGAGTPGNPAVNGGAGGGGGANSTTTHAGGAAAKSRYCTSGAGGSVTGGVGTAGGNGVGRGCGGGGGSYDGTVRAGGSGADGYLIVKTW